MTNLRSATAADLDGLTDVLADIDAANAGDPTHHEDGPLAFVQGQLASTWLARLEPAAGPALQVAARAHHLYRWEIERSDYPTGRAGYLRWRRDNKQHQAESAAAILLTHDWPNDDIERVRELLGRTRLQSDVDTQTLEDVACLVFLETQFEAMVARTGHDHMVDIVAKTLRKMSTAAIALAGELPLTADGASVIAEAVAKVASNDGE